MRHFGGMLRIVLFIFPAVVWANSTGSKLGHNHLSEKALLIELTGKDEARLSELDLYAEIVDAFQKKNEIAFQSRLQAFLERFPKSSFADNALYLAGRVALDQKRYAAAIQYFHRVTAEYPRSNRVVSAQFAKAMTYKQMKLETEARRTLNMVMKRFPGSPESFRAENEMRLLN